MLNCPSSRRHAKRKPLRSRSAIIGACILVSSLLPLTDAVHHMKLKPPRKIGKREDETPLIVTNMCTDTIWPGITTQNGNGPGSTGFELKPGENNTQYVSENWQGRIWGRTNCSFSNSGSRNRGGNTACDTGDCGGALECEVTGNTPVSLAEFTLDAGDGQTYYDISLVDGYNLPMAIVLQPLGNSSLDDIPPNLTSPSCVATAGHLSDRDFSPYGGDSQMFLGTNSSFPLPFESEVDNNDVSRWCPWDLQVSPPTKPGDGVYPYPDDNIQRPAFDPCYSACAKWNKAEDCCTGDHDSPGTCSPSDYSRAAKRVCPDAYSYAFDDQTSTFIIPSGAGFQVVFCPGGRSTNILASERERLRELAENGHVDQKRRTRRSSTPRGAATRPSIVRKATRG
ncbi:Osmotin, thaumatin-like protein [Patellaria atrata CBS 101060]|uniref:Osmotin, thaumatin-like protein n=1 Tax=Patellaria atrata CBS 101060 TaxID=1346257 RepID=A0A9P4SJY8_9PEZI|nr:Osmotin, thaumatin-like protein [Patellaria atrata CBS 101060]